MKMNLFFKEPEGERKEKFFFWTRYGLKVVVMSIATTTTDKQSSNCEFFLSFSNFHLSLFSDPGFTQYLFPDCSPHLSHFAHMDEHSKKAMKKM
jgi:hypothetical protein